MAPLGFSCTPGLTNTVFHIKNDSVTFWNPFGNKYVPRGPAGLEHGYPTSYGRFVCPLPEAVQWFGSFSCETDEPATTVN